MVQKILSIDDHGDTIADLIGLLKSRGIEVYEARTVKEAESRLRSIHFDFILADARLPVGNELEMSAGQALLTSLQAGEMGDINRNTPCMILTSYPYEVNREEIVLNHYRGLLSKLSMSPEIIGDMIGIDLTEDGSAAGEDVRRQLLEVHKSYDPTDTSVAFAATGSDGGAVILSYPVSELPPDVRFQYRHAKRPMLVWASINIAADDTRDMKPRSFELYLGESVEQLERNWKSLE